MQWYACYFSKSEALRISDSQPMRFERLLTIKTRLSFGEKMAGRISIIILNWNGRKWLKESLPSILNQKVNENFEVLLVDNGSIDDSVKYVKSRFPQVKLIELGENYGFAEGNNQGLRHAIGDYLIFVNMDTKAEDGWLKNLVKAADSHPEYSILCSIQLPSQGKNRIRTLNAFGDPTPSPFESTLALTDSIFASGGCFLIKREWLNKLGCLFDPYYFCYAEDLELSLRTILLGGRIGYVRDSRINHFIGGAGLSSSPKMHYLATRNTLLTYYKLFAPDNFARIFPVNVARKFIKFLRLKQILNVVALFGGIMGFFFCSYRYRMYRNEFAKIKKRTDKYVFQRFFYKREIEKKILKKIYRI